MLVVGRSFADATLAGGTSNGGRPMARQKSFVVAIGLLTLLTVLAGSCGGSGGDDSTGGMMPPPGVQPNIASIQEMIFTPRCALSGCHTGPNPQNNLDLSAGQASANLINVSATWDPTFYRVEPNNANDSYLYMKLINDPRIMGVQMPKTGRLLTNEELGAIFEWIDQGGQSPPGY